MITLDEWIKKYEGYKSHPYLDTTGKSTIGWGRNIEDNGINILEANFMLSNDIERCKNELTSFVWYDIQPEIIKEALVHMCFNLGLTRLLTFKKMLAALTTKDYAKASKECLESKWAKQVGIRAKDIALQIRIGEDVA